MSSTLWRGLTQGKITGPELKEQLLADNDLLRTTADASVQAGLKAEIIEALPAN
jgi:hypothetical protein